MGITRIKPGRRAAALAGLPLLAFGLAGPAAGQDEWVQQVRRQIQAGAADLETHGYSMSEEIRTGTLDAGASETISLDLRIGVEYKIVGVCDTDCSDVDATLIDPAGNEVDSDVLTDDVPVVGVTPPRSGTYSVVVSMVSCASEPCYYGLGVFER